MCLDDAFARRALGPICAQKLRARLDDLRAAVNLGCAPRLPGRFHPIQIESQDCFALHLDAQRFLLIEPVRTPSVKPKGGTGNLLQITAVRVIDVRSS